MSRFRILVTAVALAVGLVGIQIQSVAAAQTETEGVISFAQRQLDKPFKLGSNGLASYDCSGLVFRAFAESGLAARIGGEKRARGYYKWFKNNGRLTRKPAVGDLVVWAYKRRPVTHMGIFVGYNKRGQPLALSALTSGVTIHKVNRISVPLKAYLDVNLGR